MVVSKVLTIHRKRDGIYVTGASPQYYLSESSTELTGGTWSDVLTYEAGKYVWTRDKHIWSDGREPSYGEPHLNEYIALIGKKATFIGEDGIYSGTLSADTIAAIQIAASQITAGKLSASVELQAKKGTVGGWSLGEHDMEAGDLKLSANGYIVSVSDEDLIMSYSHIGSRVSHNFEAPSATDKYYWRLNSDGSGMLASGNISWNTEGKLKVSGEIEAKKGTVGGWDISEDKIYKETADDNPDYSIFSEISPTRIYFHKDKSDATAFGHAILLNEEGLFMNDKSNDLTNGSYKNVIKSDGSGALASGNISWDEKGELKQHWEKTIDENTRHIVDIDGKGIDLKGWNEASSRTLITRGNVVMTDSQLDATTRVSVHGIETDRSIRTEYEIRIVRNINHEDEDEDEAMTDNVEVKFTEKGVTFWHGELEEFVTMKWKDIYNLMQ